MSGLWRGRTPSRSSDRRSSGPPQRHGRLISRPGTQLHDPPISRPGIRSNQKRRSAVRPFIRRSMATARRRHGTPAIREAIGAAMALQATVIAAQVHRGSSAARSTRATGSCWRANMATALAFSGGAGAMTADQSGSVRAVAAGLPMGTDHSSCNTKIVDGIPAQRSRRSPSPSV